MKFSKVRATAGLVLVLLTAASIVISACGGNKEASEPTGSAVLPHTISGRVDYAGSSLSNHKIVIAVNRQGESSPAYSAILTKAGAYAILTKAGAYAISNVADGAYTIIAFIDLGDDMGPPQPNEPSGTYDAGNDGTPDSFVLKDGGPATGIDITIVDRRVN